MPKWRTLATGFAFILFLTLTLKVFSEPENKLMFDFGKYDQSNWISVRDPAVKEIGKFIQKMVLFKIL